MTVQISGRIESIDGNTLEVGGYKFVVTDKTAFADEAFGDLTIGNYIEVEGVYRNDVLVATKVKGKLQPQIETEEITPMEPDDKIEIDSPSQPSDEYDANDYDVDISDDTWKSDGKVPDEDEVNDDKTGEEPSGLPGEDDALPPPPDGFDPDDYDVDISDDTWKSDGKMPDEDEDNDDDESEEESPPPPDDDNDDDNTSGDEPPPPDPIFLPPIIPDPPLIPIPPIPPVPPLPGGGGGG